MYYYEARNRFGFREYAVHGVSIYTSSAPTVPLWIAQRLYSPIVCELCSRNVHWRTVTCRAGLGVGAGGGAHPSCCPHPPYPDVHVNTLLYICTVHELCSRTFGEYRLRSCYCRMVAFCTWPCDICWYFAAFLYSAWRRFFLERKVFCPVHVDESLSISTPQLYFFWE
jgi:hypothetical protein